MSASHEHFRIAEAAALSRKRDPAFASWATGYGVIEHDDVTQVRVYDMAGVLVQRGAVASRGDVYRVLAAADRLLRVVLAWFGALVAPTSVYLTGRDFESGELAAATAVEDVRALARTLTLAERVAGTTLGPAPLAARTR